MAQPIDSESHDSNLLTPFAIVTTDRKHTYISHYRHVAISPAQSYSSDGQRPHRVVGVIGTTVVTPVPVGVFVEVTLSKPVGSVAVGFTYPHPYPVSADLRMHFYSVEWVGR